MLLYVYTWGAADNYYSKKKDLDFPSYPYVLTEFFIMRIYEFHILILFDNKKTVV